MYKAVLPPRRVLRAKLKTEHISERKGKCEIASGKPRSTCRVFGVDEVLNCHQRVIEHPADINDATPEVDRVEFLSGEARTRAVLPGETVLDLDFSDWFDQFGLPAELRPWLMFAAGGCLWQLMVLPLGLRHSVAVAHHRSFVHGDVMWLLVVAVVFRVPPHVLQWRLALRLPPTQGGPS
jgi:hypothetical protein